MIHKTSCECRQCLDVGGIRRLVEIYSADDFTERDLRKFWVWLKRKLWYGDCHLSVLNFADDPTAPLLSLAVDCATESIVFGDASGKIKLLTLTEILMP